MDLCVVVLTNVSMVMLLFLNCDSELSETSEIGGPGPDFWNSFMIFVPEEGERYP